MSSFTFNPLQMAIKPLYLQAIASDQLFAEEVRTKEARTEKPKSLAECAEYIMGEAYEYASKHKDGNFGLAGCSDEQIVEMIKHYYDEDDIKIHKVGAATKAEVKVAAPAKPKKPERPKEVIDPKVPVTPMIRPESKRDAKKASKEQAKAVEQLDMFADFFAC